MPTLDLDTTITLKMVVQALKAARTSIEVPGSGPGGADETVAVIDCDKFEEALREAVANAG